jgi:hypothetical protein
MKRSMDWNRISATRAMPRAPCGPPDLAGDKSRARSPMDGRRARSSARHRSAPPRASCFENLNLTHCLPVVGELTDNRNGLTPCVPWRDGQCRPSYGGRHQGSFASLHVPGDGRSSSPSRAAEHSPRAVVKAFSLHTLLSSSLCILQEALLHEWHGPWPTIRCGLLLTEDHVTYRALL